MTLEAENHSLTVGSVVDMAGVTRGKVVPAARTTNFQDTGMGASPSWNVFCVDDALAFTPKFSVEGDLRLRIDKRELRPLGHGVLWAPANFHHQNGTVAEVCTRSALARVELRLADAGMSALIGHEIEFVLVGAVPPERWSAYGLGVVLEQHAFITSLLAAAELAGLPVEQFHAEYGHNQFEISLAPRRPVEAADNLVLARILISSVAREHGLSASFSPLPTAGESGNGAHMHMSLASGDVPLFSGGDGPHGLTSRGASAIAGIVGNLGDLMAVLAGSVLSAERLKPGMWSGAYQCWGLENREAAVRFCAGAPGSASSSNVEVKCVDPTANPYLSTAVILGAALEGIEGDARLPPEVTINPALLTDAERDHAGVRILSARIEEQLTALAASPVATRVLGAHIIEALSSVRRREHETYGAADIATVAEKLRFAWTS
jgi:glutamine synthetase